MVSNQNQADMNVGRQGKKEGNMEELHFKGQLI
jgi:hypothetical protein